MLHQNPTQEQLQMYLLNNELLCSTLPVLQNSTNTHRLNQIPLNPSPFLPNLSDYCSDQTVRRSIFAFTKSVICCYPWLLEAIRVNSMREEGCRSSTMAFGFRSKDSIFFPGTGHRVRFFFN
uniref:Uncharacterized protein n=1 Tax=Opuntia streptacantha TaxID=393608 RepID=A0A7C9DS56_OPUST